MSRLPYLALSVALLVLVGCTTTVNVDYDQDTNFSALKTFRLETKPIKIADDPRLDSPLMQQRVVEAIRTGFINKGLREATDQADVRISYRIDIKQEIESDSSGVSVGMGTFSRNVGVGFGFGFPTSDVESYDRMILTIDLHRADNTLLWRGSDNRRLTSGSTPQSNTKLVNDLVEAILKTYPPR